MNRGDVVTTAAPDLAFAALAGGRHRDPFSLLGPHVTQDGCIVRTLQPSASTVELRLIASGEVHRMARRSEPGIFEAILPDRAIPDYRLRVTHTWGEVREIDDPYRYGRVITDFDLHLFGEGTHYRVYEKLGAHRVRLGEAVGVHFAVWAPNAERVSVIGDFNGWDGRTHPMRLLIPGGVWELFIPDLADGQRYKFEIRTAAGEILKKSDPFGVAFEKPPQTASVVRDISDYEWGDRDWIASRAQQGGWFDRPLCIYEVHLGSWARVPEEGQRYLTYRELADRLVPYVKDLWDPLESTCRHASLSIL